MGKEESPLILFDGVCNFCEGVVKFMIKRDKKEVFQFASLQSEAGQKLLKKHQLDQENFDTFILSYQDHIYVKSEAALKTAALLPFPWSIFRIFHAVPRPVRDGLYSYAARNRYKWFGKKESCMIPDPSVKNRFLK
ncbi:thiol-disulfide oxidoreductase DCC family protein [Bacillus sp. FJAT-42376]|uniref:thiol-disulfide oxidoreductase DCC family protein n=1 Tax=Bacillus sp. FJAT-42376 TaxID=2014076 RepID=UPI000F4E4929|nr:thiol-disulfide oxidoreductase DCC family protein [Bacillus sp. FJAT-42376]AZB44956.1 thiol-disulfide oxidoreductase DCC family protein [Bacillus sp. FJAT-42376]